MARAAIHPGEILEDEIEALGITVASLARAIRVPSRRLSRITSGKGAITAEMALRLGHWFGTGPELWMNLQKQYELRVAEQEVGREIRETITPRAA